MANARSSIVFVAQMNSRCCCRFLTPLFSVLSAAVTLPEGYSPPIPMPRRNRNAMRQLKSVCPGPALHAHRMEKTKMMPVHTNMDHLRLHLSEKYPNVSWPRTMPAKPMAPISEPFWPPRPFLNWSG